MYNLRDVSFIETVVLTGGFQSGLALGLGSTLTHSNFTLRHMYSKSDARGGW